jgi:branched-chain amino acid transport system substrate-binding protein
MGWQPNFQDEARIYAKYILKEKPGAKIAVLYQNDDFGKDYLKGLKDGLGDKSSTMIVVDDAYEPVEPTIDSHIVRMKSLNADVFVDVTTPKFTAQAIRKMAEIGWKPLHFLTSISASVGSVIKPAGFEHSQGIISSIYLKDPSDPYWKNDPGVRRWNEFLDKYYPDANRIDVAIIYA